MILLRALVATAFLASVSWAEVIELGVDNLAETIKSKQWTLVMFYDRYNDKENEDLNEIMLGLESLFASPKVGFAKLDQRRHPAYRKAYMYEDDPTPFFFKYYNGFPDSTDEDLVISHWSFMNLKGDFFWQSKIVLMGHDFNAYSEVDMNLNAHAQAQIPILARWIESAVSKTPEETEAITLSPINKEAEIASVERDNSFNFERYHEELEEAEEEEDEEKELFLLESGSSENGDGPFIYARVGLDETNISEGWLDILTLVIDRYLNWVEGYETKWDEERKRREDEQTNFGPLLQEMNEKINDLLVKVFEPKCKPPIADRNCDATTVKSARELRESDDKEDAVPNLKPYLDEMVLGYGRSPTSLGLYLKGNVIEKLGPDAATRREARKTANSEDFPMFQRMREYMKIVEETNSDGELYLNPLANLATEWHNILVDFQFKLTKHYVEYLAEHPLPNHDFKRLDIEVIDMEKSENFDLLTDYDEFHKLYTVPGVPVVFGNVNMTNHQYTPEYLIEQCSAADVTEHIKVSNPVGKKSTDGWGGLDDYVLHDELLNDEREEDGDRSLTLEQFILLSEELDNIYLHDYSLPDHCEQILYEETLYGTHQKYRIPSIVASYDLFQRVTQSGYSSSWPSLFFGKKGSNSKLHVDSGATGFFMYLVSGRKRWVVTSPSERPFLYESILKQGVAADVLGIDKHEDVNEFLSERFPLLHRAENIYEVIQEPGQLIYIPPDSPHAVENLEDIVGIALNLGPRDGIARHLHDHIHLTRQFGDIELAIKYILFEDNADRPMPTKDPLYMTFAEYHAQM